MEFEKLNDNDWPIWKIMVKVFLVGKEFDQPLKRKEAQFYFGIIETFEDQS